MGKCCCCDLHENLHGWLLRYMSLTIMVIREDHEEMMVKLEGSKDVNAVCKVNEGPSEHK